MGQRAWVERSPGGAQPHGAAGGGEAAGGVGLVEWVSHVSGDIGQLATPSERHSDWMTSWRWQQPCSHGWLMTKPGIRVSVVKAGSGSQAAAASSSFEVVGPCGCRGAGGWITRKGRQLWQAHQPAFRLDGQLTVSAHWPTARWDDQLTASAHRPTARWDGWPSTWDGDGRWDIRRHRPGWVGSHHNKRVGSHHNQWLDLQRITSVPGRR